MRTSTMVSSSASVEVISFELLKSVSVAYPLVIVMAHAPFLRYISYRHQIPPHPSKAGAFPTR